MIQKQATHRLFRPDLEHPIKGRLRAGVADGESVPIPWVEPVDISNALLYLAFDDARRMTRVTPRSTPVLASSDASLADRTKPFISHVDIQGMSKIAGWERAKAPS